MILDKVALYVAVASALLLGSATSSKDDSYYKAGSGNPNVDQKMYWKDAENILQDLDEFETLYVEFQHCAWTWMDSSDSDEEEGSVDENDYWYMGKVGPFGANVAFSLYGSLKGQKFRGCNSNTFINSFYTKNGFEEFVYAMTYAGQQSFSKYDFSGYSSQCQGYKGVGCDYKNGFAVHKYSSQNCDPANYAGVSDSMSSLNNAMESAQCVNIYDRSSGYNWNGYNYTIYGTPLELLSYSEACFYQNFWSPDGQCPDPYNKIQFYQKNFNNGIVKSKKDDPYQQYSRQVAETKQLFNLGTTMLVASALLLLASYMYPNLFQKAGQKKSRAAQPDLEQQSKPTTVQNYQSSPPRVIAPPRVAASPASAPSTPKVLTPEKASPQKQNEVVIMAPVPAPRPQTVETQDSSPKKKGKKFLGLFGKK